MIGLLHRLTEDRSGNVVLTFALSSFVVIGLSALAITTGDAYSIRSKTQLALDAAVLGAASASYELADEDRIALAHRIYSGDRTARADGTPEITITQATNVKFSISKTAVHGEVEFNMNSPFLGVFGESFLVTRVVSAARRGFGAPVCVLGLDPTEEQTIDINGQASVEAVDCATQANSKSGEGMRQVGASKMKAQQIGVTGGFIGENFWRLSG